MLQVLSYLGLELLGLFDIQHFGVGNSNICFKLIECVYLNSMNSSLGVH